MFDVSNACIEQLTTLYFFALVIASVCDFTAEKSFPIMNFPASSLPLYPNPPGPSIPILALSKFSCLPFHPAVNPYETPGSLSNSIPCFSSSSITDGPERRSNPLTTRIVLDAPSWR